MNYPVWQGEPITVGSPAAGLGFTYTVPGSEVQRVMGVSFVLVNAVAVASRIPRVEYVDGSGTVFFAVAAPFVTTSGKTARFNFGVGLNQFGADDAAQIGAGLPPFTLTAGNSVRVAVTAINASDQISGVHVFVEQMHVRDDGLAA